MPEAIGWQYGVARGPAECEPEFARLWNGLGGLWVPTLGPTGSKLWDLSGRANHGALTNMDPATDWVPTPYGWGLDLDGTDDMVVLTGTESGVLSFASGPFSIACRVMTRTKAAGDFAIVNKRVDALGYQYQYRVTGGTHSLLRTGGSVTGGGSFANNTWYDLAVTVNADGTGQFWRNGVADGAAFANKAITAYATPVVIGNQANAEGAWELDGQIAYVGMWARALHPGEVAQVYADPGGMTRPARRPWLWVTAGAGGTEYVHTQTGVMIVTGAQAAQAGYIAAQAGALVLTGAQVAQALMQAAQVGSVVLTGTQAAQAEMVAAQVGSLILGGTQVAQADYTAAQAGDLVLGGDQATQLGYTHAQAGSLVLTGEQVTQAVYTLAQTGALELSADQLVTVASIMAQTGSLILTGSQVVVIPGVGRGWLPLMRNAGRYQ